MEIWKIIDEFDSYSVSNLGNIRNDVTGKILKGRNNKGYLQVVLHKKNFRKSFLIHRLVALAFIENPDDKKCVDHIDGDKINNNISNLRFATKTENGRNAKISVANTSGFKGVSWFKRDKKWRARIEFDGKEIHLGLFENLEDAVTARQKKVAETFGPFTHSCEKI